MKIAIVTPYFHPKIGGLENYVLQIAKGLNKQADVTVITTNETLRKEYRKYNGIKIISLPTLCKLSNTPLNPLWLFQLKRIFKELNPDIINVHTPVPGIADIAALIANKEKLFITYHTTTMKTDNRCKNIIVFLYEKLILPFMLRKAKAVICTSEYVRQEFLHLYKNKSITVTPGVDTSIFSFKDKTKSDDAIVLGIVGGLNQFESHKNTITVIKAVRELKRMGSSIRLNLVGSGDRLGEFKKVVKMIDLANNVKFLGKQDSNAMSKFYYELTALIVPSTNESFGMVITESMSCGTPVIGNNKSGIPYVIQDNITGMLFNNSVNSLCEKIQLLHQDQALYKKIVSNGKQYVDLKFAWDAKSTSTYEFFRKGIIKNV